jgi:selenocysteine lyase/cysteine desulfurase
VDATHAAGAAPVPARLCDFVVSATYKWLLGCQGAALLLWNEERGPEPEPAIAGWRSVLEDVAPDGDPSALTWRSGAERLEGGNPAWIAIVYLDVALQYLRSVGIERIYAHDRALSARMHAGLRELGVPLATPDDPRWRAGNNCFWTEHPETLRDELLARNVLVNGGTGRIRIGTHIWNDEADVDAALTALEALVAGAPVAS